MRKVGTAADDIKTFLYGLSNYDGITGKTSFDSNGDVLKPISIKIVKNQKFEVLIKEMIVN